MQKMQRYRNIYDQDLINQAEYDRKKQRLLNSM